MTERNFVNRTLYHGDNLDFLRGLNSGTVNLIATDPPFKKGKDFHATPGSLASGGKFEDRWRWKEDVHNDWQTHIMRDEIEVWHVVEVTKKVYGYDMAAFLCWMAVRLLEMRRVLADDGSIYVHIDRTAHAYVKVLMDVIFGRRNFRNEIVWCYAGGGGNRRGTSRTSMTPYSATPSLMNGRSTATMYVCPMTLITRLLSLWERTHAPLGEPMSRTREGRW